MKRVLDADRAARAGDVDFKYRADLRELSGATLGLVGLGRIARRVAHVLGVGFGMRVLGYARRPTEVVGIERVETLEALLAASDVLSLHVPATPATVGLIGARELALMRPGAILLNTARGVLLDEVALAAALAAGHLGGAGLDVFAREPLPPDHPLAASPRVVLSPHVAGSTLEAARRTAVDVAQQVVAALRGERPRHLVDPAVWSVRRRG
jgi:D-3-phosphoglycerate dehydrogenase